MTDHDAIQQYPAGKTPFLYAGLFGILAGFCVLTMVVGDQHGWFRGLGISPDTLDLLFGFVTGLLLAASLVTLLKAKFRRDGASRIDVVQSQQRRMLIAITLLIAGFGVLAILNPLHHNGQVATDFAIEFALLSVAAAAVAIFGVGFMRRGCRVASSDEFAQALRARATQIGYLLAVAGLSTAYLLCVFRPDLMVVALPSALLVAVVAPAIYFLVADRNAAND